MFEADLRQGDPLLTLAHRIELGEPPVREFTASLVEGVVGEQAHIDQVITEALAAGWTLERMPRVDRNLARVAVFEMFYTDTPPEVAVKAAVDLAAELSTDESPDFLNGLLGKILLTLRETYLAVPRTTDESDDADSDHTTA